MFLDPFVGRFLGWFLGLDASGCFCMFLPAVLRLFGPFFGVFCGPRNVGFLLDVFDYRCGSCL